MQKLVIFALIVFLANTKIVIDLTNSAEFEYDQLVKIGLGEKLAIKLRENPSTGYQWHVVEGELERHGLRGVIKQVNSIFGSDAAEHGQGRQLGAGGIRTLEFEGTQVGKGKLFLFNARIWQLEKEIEQNLDLTVNNMYRAVAIQVVEKDDI